MNYATARNMSAVLLDHARIHNRGSKEQLRYIAIAIGLCRLGSVEKDRFGSANQEMVDSAIRIWGLFSENKKLIGFKGSSETVLIKDVVEQFVGEEC